MTANNLRNNMFIGIQNLESLLVASIPETVKPTDKINIKNAELYVTLGQLKDTFECGGILNPSNKISASDYQVQKELSDIWENFETTYNALDDENTLENIKTMTNLINGSYIQDVKPALFIYLLYGFNNELFQPYDFDSTYEMNDFIEYFNHVLTTEDNEQVVSMKLNIACASTKLKELLVEIHA